MKRCVEVGVFVSARDTDDADEAILLFGPAPDSSVPLLLSDLSDALVEFMFS